MCCVPAGVVDVCLIPEVKFDLQGDRGLLRFVQGLLDEKGHCVVCIAEGAGQVGVSLWTCLALPWAFKAVRRRHMKTWHLLHGLRLHKAEQQHCAHLVVRQCAPCTNRTC